MERPLIELSQDLASLSDVDQFWMRIKSELAQYGVTSVFYGAISSVREAGLHGVTKSLIWKSDHPQEWFDTYGEETFLDEELAIELVFSETFCTGATCLVWHDPRLLEDASQEQIKRVENERDMGLHAGVSFVGGLAATGLSVGELSPAEFDRMWPEKRHEILAICGLLEMGMREQHLRSVVGLTGRQEECLVWLAAGLRPGQIADRLNVSDKTIEHHIAGARKRLNASTRDQAVVKALMLNLIRP